MDFDSVVVAAFVTGAAPDTRLGIDYMFLFSISANRADGAYLCAESTPGAGISNFVSDECSADRCRAAMFDNMGQIFIAKVSDGGQHWVRCCLA